MLDEPYNSPLLLLDCIIRAVKHEPFYAPLIATTIPQDPNTLHTRLHQCIRQQQNANPKLIPSAPSAIYLADEEDEANTEEFELHYMESGNPVFKRRILRRSSSFSMSEHNGIRGNYRRSFQKGGPTFHTSSRVHFTPTKNSRDQNGNVMLCSFCNSCFHLIRDCPDWHKHLQYSMERLRRRTQPMMNIIRTLHYPHKFCTWIAQLMNTTLLLLTINLRRCEPNLQMKLLRLGSSTHSLHISRTTFNMKGQRNTR